MSKQVKRLVSTGFWEDQKVMTLFTPEDKYFMLYLLTNPHTTQLGIYQLVPKIAAFEMGYSVEAVESLLERFEEKYGVIRYNPETMEIAIKNYLKHSIVKGGKPVMDCLLKEEQKIKDKSLLAFVYDSINDIDTLNITVKEYLEHININNNDNDNENERIVNESYHESSDDYESFFNDVWKLYPNKKGKGAVSKTKKKELLKVGKEQMIRCIERYIHDHDELQRSGKFCPEWKNGSTFFNSGYVDYLDENYESADSNGNNVSTEIYGGDRQ